LQTERETEIASLRNQIKKGKYKSRPTVNDDHDADDERPELAPGASSSTTSIPSDNHSIRDLINDTLAQFMAANPSLHASPAPSMPKRRKTRNPHPNVGSVKANRELKESELATLQPEDKAGWKVRHASNWRFLSISDSLYFIGFSASILPQVNRTNLCFPLRKIQSSHYRNCETV